MLLRLEELKGLEKIDIKEIRRLLDDELS